MSDTKFEISKSELQDILDRLDQGVGHSIDFLRHPGESDLIFVARLAEELTLARIRLFYITNSIREKFGIKRD